MAGDEKAGFHIVFLEHPQQARDADLGCEDAALDVGRTVAATLGPDPTGNRVDIGAKGTQDFLHDLSPLMRINAVANAVAAATPSITGK